MTEANPWSGWEPTVEAAPDDVLVSTLLARTEQLESARMWTVALENRLAEVRRVVEECPESLLRDCLRDWLAADLIAQ